MPDPLLAIKRPDHIPVKSQNLSMTWIPKRAPFAIMRICCVKLKRELRCCGELWLMLMTKE